MKRPTALFLLFPTLMLLSCKPERAADENPLLVEWTTPYGVPPFDRIRPHHFLPALEQGMARHEAEIEALVADGAEPTFENVVAAYDRSGRLLARTALILEMLCAAENTPELQAVQEAAAPLLAAHADRIRLDEGLFAKIRTLYEQRELLDLEAEQLRLLEKTYRAFVRSGALLDAAQKERLRAINAELSVAAVQFGNRVRAQTNDFVLLLGSSDLEGLPSNVRELARAEAVARGEKDKYAFTLHKPSMIPFLTYASRRDLRERLYTAYLERCARGDADDNRQLIDDFVRLRTERAHLLGYPSHAAYVIDDQMARTPEAVYELLDELWTPALESARAELAELEPLLHTDHPRADFASWDWWYYAEKVRKRQYALDEEMLRPYFSLENVQEGVFFLANRLYGITFRPVAVPLYHPEAVAYEVLDVDQSHLGVLCFDYFTRAGKSPGAWCGNYVEQTYEDGERVAPVVAIVCNFPRPAGNTPALLTLDETRTLFHEFGHALHFLFHEVRYRGLREVEGDFVELPSQLMENWAFDEELLKQYAVHYRTREVIPRHLVEKLRRSRLFNQGFRTTELVAAALADLDLHSMRSYGPFDPVEFGREALTERRGLLPQIEPRYRYPYFSHIFDGGYSAGYYFYLWAEVLDKDAFEAFRESGDRFDRRTAERFRREVLCRGGSRDGMTLYRAFRGQDPDKRPMLRSRGLPVPEPEPEPETSGEEPAPESNPTTEETHKSDNR